MAALRWKISIQPRSMDPEDYGFVVTSREPSGKVAKTEFEGLVPALEHVQTNVGDIYFGGYEIEVKYKQSAAK